MLEIIKEFWNDMTVFGKIMVSAFIAMFVLIILLRILVEVVPTPAKADPRTTCSVQRLLIQKGFYDGEVDCIYGRGTRDAIAAFQRSLGLPDDGIAGADTLDALFGRPEVEDGGRELARPPAADDYQPERPTDRAALGQCGDMITVTGTVKLSTGWATSNAIKVWQTEVSRRYGNEFVRWERAKDTSIKCKPACATCTVRFECTATGVPCQG